LDYQNNYIERSKLSQIVASKFLNVLHNYFDPTKSFLDLYPAKFFDTSVKLFFLYVSDVELSTQKNIFLHNNVQ